jgi:hypothetical protein
MFFFTKRGGLLMRRILSVVFLAANVIFAGCGQLQPQFTSEAAEKISEAMDNKKGPEPASDRSAAAQNSALIAEAKTNPDAIFCPVGSWYSSSEKMCVTETQAVGPFTREMINLCKKFGGGDKACESGRWERKFAGRLRLSERCPRGAGFDAARDACVEGSDVFGPFRIRDVDDCKRKGGGPACESMRWNVSFMAIRVRGGSANRKLFDYYSVRSNYDAVFDKVLTFYPSGRRNGCVAFMSTALRESGTPVPLSEYINGESVSLVTKPFAQYLMQRLNWTKITAANNLQAGDVVLTEDDSRYPSYPAHTYMFYGWSNQKAGIGWVIDNQDFIHERNIFGYGTYNFTPFAYALRSPE